MKYEQPVERKRETLGPPIRVGKDGSPEPMVDLPPDDDEKKKPEKPTTPSQAGKEV